MASNAAVIGQPTFADTVYGYANTVKDGAYSAASSVYNWGGDVLQMAKDKMPEVSEKASQVWLAIKEFFAPYFAAVVAFATTYKVELLIGVGCLAIGKYVFGGGSTPVDPNAGKTGTDAGKK